MSWRLKPGESRTLSVSATPAPTLPVVTPPAEVGKGSIRVDVTGFCLITLDGVAVSSPATSYATLEVAAGAHQVECVMEDPSLPKPRIKKQRVTVTAEKTVGVQFNMLAD